MHWYARKRPNGPESPLGLLVCSIIGSPGIKTAVTLRDRPKVHKQVSRKEGDIIMGRSRFSEKEKRLREKAESREKAEKEKKTLEELKKKRERKKEKPN